MEASNQITVIGEVPAPDEYGDLVLAGRIYAELGDTSRLEEIQKLARTRDQDDISGSDAKWYHLAQDCGKEIEIIEREREELNGKNS